jgi:hypothetical protein
MSTYIASNDNRFYAAVETNYGEAAAVAASNRIPAVALKLRQEMETPRRIDKTGGRTFPGLPGGFRKRTMFDLTTLMVGWSDFGSEPAYGALFRGALGGAPLFFSGGVVQLAPDPSRIIFLSPHGLVVDQAVSCGGELRFVASVPDSQSVIVNAPFSQVPQTGSPVGPTVTYLPANQIPSLTVFDYWDPSDSVQRLVTGAGVNTLHVKLNGDFHQFSFTGLASDMIDNVSFVSGQAGLSSFPSEPTVGTFNYSLVPGNLGQAWVGSVPQQFFSVLEAEVLLDNDLDTRSKEFGAATPRGIAPGIRVVTANFRLLANTRTETRDLYLAARQRTPVRMMLQLGQQAGHLCGVYMKTVVQETPEFDDADTRLEWRFRNCRAQGTLNDELLVAFG